MPLFGALADLVAFGDIAEAADEAGLDGVFVWDHVLSPVEGNWPIADPWVALAVAATRSRRIRIGPMVTPLARRRLINVSQATLSLDQLSAARVILGLGLGSDRARELSAFGEPDDPAERAAKLTEGAELLGRLWSQERVQHRTGAWVVDERGHAIRRGRRNLAAPRLLARQHPRPSPPLHHPIRSGVGRLPEPSPPAKAWVLSHPTRILLRP